MRADLAEEAGVLEDACGSHRTSIWDPRTWAEPLPYAALTVSRCGERFVLLDLDDYEWAVQWAWSLKPSRGGRKFYAYRSTRLGNHKSYCIYLHVAVMERSGVPRPWADAVVDHRNGNSLDCRRRRNLRWATRSMNRLNIDGAYPYVIWNR